MNRKSTVAQPRTLFSRAKTAAASGLAALTLAGGLALARPAFADETMPAIPEATTTVETVVNTTPYGVFADNNGAEDGALITTYETTDGNVTKQWQLVRQENWSGTFNDDEDRTQLSYKIADEDSMIKFGARVTSNEDGDSLSGSVVTVNKTKFGDWQNALVLNGEKAIGVTYFEGKNIDASIGGEVSYEGTAGETTYTLGAHDRAGTIGAWLGLNADSDASLAVCIDKPGFSLYSFGKARDDGSGFNTVQMVFNGAQGKGLFSQHSGAFTSWILADQMPRPTFRDLGTYLENVIGDDGAWGAQVAWNNGTQPDDAYSEVRAGTCIGNYCGDIGVTTDGHQFQPTIGGYTQQQLGPVQVGLELEAGKTLDDKIDKRARITGKVQW